MTGIYFKTKEVGGVAVNTKDVENYTALRYVAI